MKKSKWLLVAGLAIVLMTIACQNQMGFADNPQGGDVNVAATSKLPIQYNPSGNWFTYFLWTPPGGATYPLSIGNDAGGNGYVMLEKVGTNLIVTYQTSGDWYIQKTHIDVALTKDGLHHNKVGNLVPGQFLFQGPDQSIPYPQQVIMTIPWDPSWDNPATEGLYIAALANVCEGIQNADGSWSYWNFNTACGGNVPGPEPKQIKLPDFCVTCVTMIAGENGGSDPSAPYQVQFYCSNPLNPWGFGGPLDDDYDVIPWVTYNAWCMDEHHAFGVAYLSVKLMSCFDPTLPLAYQHANWGAVAWLINNRSEWGTLTLAQMADIFYVLLDQTDFHSVPGSGPVHDLYVKALTHVGYRPGAGSFVPVVTTDQGNTPGFQIMFVEIDP